MSWRCRTSAVASREERASGQTQADARSGRHAAV
jgi:hypothetical protein